jgi:hypothetical protein
MPQKDYSTWLTKQQAAQIIGASTKQLERWAQSKRLQSKLWKRPEGGPKIVVYHPGDVEQLAHERNSDESEPFVLPAAAEEKPKVNGSHAIAVRQPPAGEFLQTLAAAIAGASQTSETRLGLRLAERLYLTIPEAAEFTGLGVGYLRRQIAERKLELVKGAGPRRADVLRRTELEKL